MTPLLERPYQATCTLTADIETNLEGQVFMEWLELGGEYLKIIIIIILNVQI